MSRQCHCRKKVLIAVVSELEIPGGAWRAVRLRDVRKAPLDLSGRVGLPVRARGGHLVTGQRLRDTVRARAWVFRVIHPAALPVPQVEQAGPLGLLAEAERREHVVPDALRGPGVGWLRGG